MPVSIYFSRVMASVSYYIFDLEMSIHQFILLIRSCLKNTAAGVHAERDPGGGGGTGGGKGSVQPSHVQDGAVQQMAGDRRLPLR